MKMTDTGTVKGMERREFIKSIIRGVLLFITGGFFTERIFRSEAGRAYWQIDPGKCVQCGRCSSECVLDISAVKCFHRFESCGYCKLCFGYFQPGAEKLNEAAENQICPVNAINRKYIEDPYFEYTIDRNSCIGCGLCVKGCKLFGNGSLFLQVDHAYCKNCNECRIAANCAGNAFYRSISKGCKT